MYDGHLPQNTDNLNFSSGAGVDINQEQAQSEIGLNSDFAQPIERDQRSIGSSVISSTEVLPMPDTIAEKPQQPINPSLEQIPVPNFEQPENTPPELGKVTELSNQNNQPVSQESLAKYGETISMVAKTNGKITNHEAAVINSDLKSIDDPSDIFKYRENLMLAAQGKASS